MAKIDTLTQYEVAYLESRLIRKVSGLLKETKFKYPGEDCPELEGCPELLGGY